MWRGERVAFVPTMGALHEGHLSLIRGAKKRSNRVVVSIFVNPLQFGPNEDYDAYPRNLSSDQKNVGDAGADLLWTPSVSDLYAPSFNTFVEVGKIGKMWEGKARPGHFPGVATVVTKLLQVVQPSFLYLGQKDYQQTRVIAQVVRDLCFDTTLRVMPTVREPNGLAMSSRNQRLSPQEWQSAAVLYKGLCQAKELVLRGEIRSEIILKKVTATIHLERSVQIDYVACCDPETLLPVDELCHKAILIVAVKIGSVRLIDNIFLNQKKAMATSSAKSSP